MDRITWGKFTNAGQTCIAPDYVLTDPETEAKLLPLLEKHIVKMFGTDASQSESYGRIVNDRHFERVARLIDTNKVSIGGRVDANTRFIEPTVLTDVTAEDAAMQEEIFGPVLPVLRTSELDESLRIIESGDKPLAAYLFSNDRGAQERFLDRVSAGNVCINDTMMFMAVPELPFGGVGASGMGAYSGHRGFETFSHLKSVMRRGWWPDLEVRYAPYTDSKLRFLRKIR